VRSGGDYWFNKERFSNPWFVRLRMEFPDPSVSRDEMGKIILMFRAIGVEFVRGHWD
jgi:hypothetical protein